MFFTKNAKNFLEKLYLSHKSIKTGRRNMITFNTMKFQTQQNTTMPASRPTVGMSRTLGCDKVSFSSNKVDTAETIVQKLLEQAQSIKDKTFTGVVKVDNDVDYIFKDGIVTGLIKQLSENKQAEADLDSQGCPNHVFFYEITKKMTGCST